MIKPTILITSPSIDTSSNVSGIANLTRLLLKKNNYVIYKHFIVGKKDSQRRNVFWLFSQILLIINFIKILFFDKNIKVTHINIPMSTLAIYINFILVIISSIFSKKIIVHFRGGSLSLNEEVNVFQKFVIGRCIKRANKIIVLGEKESHFIKRFYNITKISKIFILPNAVEVPELDFDTNSDFNKERLLNIIFIGRIDKDKGLEEILLSLKDIKSKVNFHFFIAGTGPDKDWFVKKCANILGDNFTYLGILNNLQKIPFYQSADIFVLPSYFEGLPNALLEAMAYGVVPIVTPVGPIPEVVIDSKNGFFVPLKDYKSISEKIETLNNDRNLLFNVRKSSYNTILKRYSIKNYIINLNRIYNSFT